MNVLVTGAAGFVGRSLLQRLGVTTGCRVVAVVRRLSDLPAGGGDCSAVVVLGVVPSLAQIDWSRALQRVDAVVHLAARVHVAQGGSADALAAFRAVNVDGTLNLARQCAAAGVKRFVFVSSAKVNGEVTRPGQRFAESDEPEPLGAYAVSKCEAEQGLRELSEQTGLEAVIIRPPLVYGTGVKANFAALIRAVQLGWPLPLGAVHNRRSLVALDNLVDFIVVCLTHPLAANQTFLVSDGQDLSTPELIRGIAAAAGTRPHLLPVPDGLLRLAAAVMGKREAMQRLCGNFQVDISKSRSLLGWTPPITVVEGLRRALAKPSEP